MSCEVLKSSFEIVSSSFDPVKSRLLSVSILFLRNFKCIRDFHYFVLFLLVFDCVDVFVSLFNQCCTGSGCSTR